MYIIIPLSLIAVSALSIFVIVIRKREYLNKLYTLNTAGEGTQSVSDFSFIKFTADLFPELPTIWNRIGINKYKSLWLVEAEKLLRKTRVLFLRVDRLSDVMIKKIRRIHLNDKLNKPKIKETIAVEAFKVDAVLTSAPVDISISQNFLKNEEERLIIQIAKDPKDYNLYEALGDIYVEMGNFSDAKESYEAALELNPIGGESLKLKLSSALEKSVSLN